MLDKNDLKQIGELIRVETRQVVREEIKPLQQDVRTLKQDVKKIRQDQNVIIKFSDEEYLDLRQRVERLEEVVNSLSIN